MYVTSEAVAAAGDDSPKELLARGRKVSDEEPERDELRKDGDEGDDQFQRATSAKGAYVAVSGSRAFRMWRARRPH